MKYFFLRALVFLGPLQWALAPNVFAAADITMSPDSSAERIEEIKRTLEISHPFNEQFYLHKELFSLLFQAFRDEGGSSQELSVILKAMVALPKEERGAYLKNIPKVFSDLAYSYRELSELAEILPLLAVAYQGIFTTDPQKGKNEISEYYKPYFLEILNLEEFLGCKVQGEALIRAQVLTVNCMFQIVVSMMFDVDFLNKNSIAFYWNALVPCYHQCLIELDKRGEFANFFSQNAEVQEGPFYIVLGEEVTRVFSARDRDDPVSLFYPLVVKYGDLEFLRARFNQAKSGLKKWDQAFEWVCLYIEGARLCPERSQFFLEKAKELVRDTLTCSWFNSDYYSWKEAEEKALRLIQEIER